MDFLGRLRGLRGVARRHAHAADAAIALAVFAATVVSTFAGSPGSGESGLSPGAAGFAAAVAAAGCGALALRRRWPLTVLAVSAIAAELFLAGTQSPGGVLVLLAPCVALYTVAERVERRRALVAGVGALTALALAHLIMHPGILGPENLAFIALGGLAIAVGDSSRNRRAYLAEMERRASRAEAERESDARRRVAEERLRIARDLHDSVGHHLALIGVQANVAARAIESRAGSGSDSGADEARDALSHVKSASRKALEELRDTVGLLRQPGDPVAPVSVPAPHVEELDSLLESLRISGLTVDYVVKGTQVPLAPAVGLTAYRVIQESLTNVCKHSARREARLTLEYGPRELRVVVNDLDRPVSGCGAGLGQGALGPGATGSGSPGEGAASQRGQGHGIAGMRERVLALGGTFTAGPRPDHAFEVVAVLPCQPLSSGGASPEELSSGGIFPEALP